MAPTMLLGALSFGTIGAVLLGMIWHFFRQLRDPANRFHARNIFVRRGKAAATKTAENAEDGSQLSKPLMVRLNESIDSQHEAEPSVASKARRTAAFNRERAGAATNS